jgi:long-chain fatty acid transport protein
MQLVASKSHLSISIALVFLVSAQAAHATNGYFASGYGIKNDATAGVGVALPQDALTIAVNPAGLTEVGSQLNLGVDVFAPKRSSQIKSNAFGPDGSYSGDGSKTFFIPSVGYNYAFTGDLTGLSLGIAAYGNGGMNTDYRSNPYARFGATGKTGVNLEQLFIAPTIALKLNEHNSVGLSVNLAYQQFKANGIGAFSAFSQDPSHVSDNGNDASYGAGLHLGWLGKINDRISVGASYQTKTRMSKFDDYAGLFADDGRFDIPASIALGVAVKPIDSLTVGFDWQRIQYSDVAAVGNSFAVLLAGHPLGSKTGPGFGWRDINVYKLGAVWQASPQLTLRGGFSVNQQPIPSSETFLNILAPAAITRHASVGASWAINAHNEISASYVRAFEQKVHGNGSIPPGFPPAGLGGGNADISLSENQFGLAWGYKF